MSDDAESGLASWATAGMESERGSVEAQPSQQQIDAATLAELKVANEAAPEPVAEAEPVEAEAGDAPSSEEPTEAAPVTAETPKAPKRKPQPLEPWIKERIGEETGKRREAERKAAEAEARAAVLAAEAEALRKRLANPGAPEAEGKPAGTPAAPDAPAAARPDYVPVSEVEARAAKLAAERELNAKADQTYYAGKAAYSDFEDAIAPLQEMGAFSRPDFYEAVFATEAPQDVLYHLGSNPNEGSRILGLLKSGQMMKAAAELTRLESRLSGEKAAAKAAAVKGTKAPAPIKPVGGSAIPTVDITKMDDDDFTSELNKRARANGWW